MAGLSTKIRSGNIVESGLKKILSRFGAYSPIVLVC